MMRSYSTEKYLNMDTSDGYINNTKAEDELPSKKTKLNSEQQYVKFLP